MTKPSAETMHKPIATLIPEPYRTELIKAGTLARTAKSADELAVIGAQISLIRAQCALAHPHIFKDSKNED